MGELEFIFILSPYFYHWVCYFSTSEAYGPSVQSLYQKDRERYFAGLKRQRA
jgi:hypothetical protein